MKYESSRPGFDSECLRAFSLFAVGETLAEEAVGRAWLVGGAREEFCLRLLRSEIRFDKVVRSDFGSTPRQKSRNGTQTWERADNSPAVL